MRARTAAGLLVAALLAPACRRQAIAVREVVCLQERSPETLDPHGGGTIAQTQEVLANVYEGVVSLDPQMVVVPALAASWTNPDENTWELKLRPDVAFHSGGTMTSEDVVFSFERARRRGHTALVQLAALEPIPGGVRLSTRVPDASLLGKLRDVYVVSKSFVAGKGEAALEGASAGTGPFAIESVSAGGEIALRAFDGAWSGRPEVDRVRFVTLTPDAEGMGRIARGPTPHVFFHRPSRPGAAEADALFARTREATLSVAYLGFDLHGLESPYVTHPDGSHRNPFLDRRVREAMALALDLDALRAAAGVGFVPTQMVPSFVFGHAPDLPTPKRDLAEARRLLATTPFAAGFRVRLDSRRVMQDLAGPVARGLSELGLTVDENLLEDEAFFEGLAHGASLYLLRFSCRYGDAQELFDRWAHSRDAVAGLGVSNYSFDASPVPGLDAAIDAARRELRVELRQSRLQEISRMLMKERLAVPVYQYEDVVYATRGLRVTPRLDTYRLLGSATFKP